MSKLDYALKRLVLPAVAVLLLAAAPGSKAETPAGDNYLAQKIMVDGLGNARFEITRKMTTEAYQKLRSLLAPRRIVNGSGGEPQVQIIRLGNAEDVLNFLDFRNLGVELEDLHGELLDTACSIRVSFRVPGWARNQGNDCWQGQVLDSLRWLDPTPHRALPPLAGSVSYEFKQESETVTLTGTEQGCPTQVEIVLPRGASKVAFAAHRISFCLPAPAAAKAPEGPAAPPEFRLNAKSVVQASLNQDYGNPRLLTKWLARTRFDNRGNEVLQHCKVRSRLELPGMATEWVEQDLGTVYPGQTVQHAIYAALPKALMSMVSRSTARITVECRYTRPDGQEEVEEEMARFDILGANDSLYTTLEASQASSFYLCFQDFATIAGSFVTGSDPVIQELKGRLIRELGGIDVAADDARAMRFLEELFNYYRKNIAYTLPPSIMRNYLLQQHLCFGRNVLQNRAGTCIDLAILYASVIEAAGLQAHLILVKGHCFPAVTLPSGKVVYIETTFCAAGTWEKSQDFRAAMKAAEATHAQSMASQQLIDIDISLLRKHGMKPTELPALAGVAPRNKI